LGDNPANLQFGQVIWAVLKDRRGFRKERPAIVLTPTDQIDEQTPIVVMCITTTFADPPPKDHFPLPWNPDPRRVETGLARRSAAVLDWLDTLYPDEVLAVKGRVPQPLMHEINRRLRTLEE
jgi:mRNA-degrading endonuclease toxin of MazEF toxin-antitoxin module